MFVTFAKPFSSFKTEGLKKKETSAPSYDKRKDGKGYEKSNEEKDV